MISTPQKSGLYGLLIYAFVLVAGLILLKSNGMVDMTTWVRWIGDLNAKGVITTYIDLIAADEEYPPLSIVILGGVGSFAKAATIHNYYAVKLSILFFLLLTSLSFYLYTRDILLTALIQFSLTLVTVALGYIDIYFTPFLVVSLFALSRADEDGDKWSYTIFSVLFTIGFLIKWQPIVMMPFVLLYLFKVDSFKDFFRLDRSLILKAVVPSLVIIFIVFLIFGKSFPEAFFNAGNEDYLSGFAANLNWVLSYLLHLLSPARYGPLTREGYVTILGTPQLPAMLVTGLKLLSITVYFFIVYSYLRVQKKSFVSLIKYSLLGFLAYFIFFTGAHENHLFVPCVLSAVLLVISKKDFAWFLLMSLGLNLNLLVFYGITGDENVRFMRSIAGFDLSVLLALLNVMVFFVLAYKTITEKEACEVEG
ncbi:MAG: hypothetical protein IME98_04270 [Proteobacteria bacterium]|nr:hypothetical protein [Pseudomonadota bacterium]